MVDTEYSKEFRDRVIQSVLSRRNCSLKDITREFGMGLATLSEWLCNENFNSHTKIASRYTYSP